MAEQTVRLALSAAAVKVETIAGVDAFGGSVPALADYVLANATIELPMQTIDDDSRSGSFDDNAPIPTGFKPTINLVFRLRGSGTPGVAPEWGRLLTATRFEEVLQAAAVGAPTAVTAGGTRTATLAAPFQDVAQAYRGMPIILSGNPATPRVSLVQDYKTGRLATFPEVFAQQLTTATLAQIPPNAMYRLTDDPALIRPVTIYAYRGGLLYKLLGCIGSVSWELTAGQPATMTFALRGQLGADPIAALPANEWSSITRPQAPIWAKGLSRLGGELARCARYTWNANTRMYEGENPEAPEGFDAPEITGAAPRIDIDPFSTTTATPIRFAALRTGASISYAAVMGTVPGNRIGFLHPSNRMSSVGLGERGEKGVDQLQLTPDQPGQGTFITNF